MGKMKWDNFAADKGIEIPVEVKVVRETKDEKKKRLKKEKEEAKRKEKAAKKRAKLFARDSAEVEMEKQIENLANGPEKSKLIHELKKLMARNQRKQHRKLLKRVEELRGLIDTFVMPEEQLERGFAVVQLQELKDELADLDQEVASRDKAAAAADAAAEPKPPQCPAGYKWGRGNNLTAGATFDAAHLLIEATRDSDKDEFEQVFELLRLGGHDMLYFINTYVCWPEGWTILHIAARVGCQSIVEFLIEYGADLGVIGPKGETPLSLATDGGHRSTAAVLRMRGLGITREWYLEFEKCKGMCMIEGCTRYEEGNNAVCKIHRDQRLVVKTKYEAQRLQQSKFEQQQLQRDWNSLSRAEQTLEHVLESNQTTCVGGDYKPEWRPHLKTEEDIEADTGEERSEA